MAFATWRASCKHIFKELIMLLFSNLYILLYILLTVKFNQNKITKTCKNITRLKHNFQYPVLSPAVG